VLTVQSTRMHLYTVTFKHTQLHLPPLDTHGRIHTHAHNIHTYTCTHAYRQTHALYYKHTTQDINDLSERVRIQLVFLFNWCSYSIGVMCRSDVATQDINDLSDFQRGFVFNWCSHVICAGLTSVQNSLLKDYHLKQRTFWPSTLDKKRLNAAQKAEHAETFVVHGVYAEYFDEILRDITRELKLGWAILIVSLLTHRNLLGEIHVHTYLHMFEYGLGFLPLDLKWFLSTFSFSHTRTRTHTRTHTYNVLVYTHTHRHTHTYTDTRTHT